MAGSAARSAVSAITLSHFRSWKTLALDGLGDMIALHGPNGAGKTNILEAVSMLSPGRGMRRATAADIARTPEALGWRVRAELASPSGPHRVDTAVDFAQGARRSVAIDEAPATQTALGEIVRVLWLTPAMDRLWTGGAAERRAYLDRATLSFDPAHAERSLNYEKAMRERNRLLKEGRAEPGWLSALEARMAEDGAAIAAARAGAAARLQSAQEGAKTLFPKAEIAILGDMEARVAAAIGEDGGAAVESLEISGIFRESLARGRARDAAAGRALEGPHRSDLEVVFAAKAQPARMCSTGEQKALLLSLVLANARALAAEGQSGGRGGAPILLLDEVAAHLDPDRRAALFGEIGELGAQAWMTGTGPELFEALGPGARRIGVAEAGGASAVVGD